MLALAAYEDSLCPQCGRPMAVCTDAKNEFRFKTGAPTRCHASTAQLIAAEKAKEAPHPRALMYHTVLVED